MILRWLRRGATAGALLIGLEVAYAVLRPVPRLPEFDPTGTFGDPEHPGLRVAVLGDSSVTAPGVEGPHQIWVSRVCSHLAQNRHVVLRSFAVGGARVADLIRDQLEPALAFSPDLVFVAVGANDVIRGVPIDDFEARLDHLVARLTETGAKVLLSGVGDMGTIPRLYPPLRNLMSRRSARFDLVHGRVAGRHGVRVLEQRADHPEIWYSDRGLWSADLFHVSAAGHARWADLVLRALEPLLASEHGPA